MLGSRYLFSLFLTVSILGAPLAAYADDSSPLNVVCSLLTKRSEALKVAVKKRKANTTTIKKSFSRIQAQLKQDCGFRGLPLTRPNPAPLPCLAVADKPVCAQPPSCKFEKCSSDSLPPQTYQSICEMNRSGAKFLYSGKCVEKPSPDDRGPWCGQPQYGCRRGDYFCFRNAPFRTYESLAELKRDGATPIHAGACEKDELPVCDKKESVCGLPRNHCFEDFKGNPLACTNVALRPVLYENECTLIADGATKVDINECDILIADPFGTSQKD